MSHRRKQQLDRLQRLKDLELDKARDALVRARSEHASIENRRQESETRLANLGQSRQQRLGEQRPLDLAAYEHWLAHVDMLERETDQLRRRETELEALVDRRRDAVGQAWRHSESTRSGTRRVETELHKAAERRQNEANVEAWATRGGKRR